jgi:hypothetical protein
MYVCMCVCVCVCVCACACVCVCACVCACLETMFNSTQERLIPQIAHLLSPIVNDYALAMHPQLSANSRETKTVSAAVARYMVFELVNMEVPAPVPVPAPGSPEYPIDEEDEPLEVAVVEALTPLPQTKGLFRRLPYPGRYFARHLTHEMALLCVDYLNDVARWRSKHEEAIYRMEENRLEQEFNAIVEAARQLHKNRKTAQAAAAATLSSKKAKKPLTIDLTGDD